MKERIIEITLGGEKKLFNLKKAVVEDFDSLFSLINKSYKQDDDFFVHGERVDNVERLKTPELCFYSLKDGEKIVACVSVTTEQSTNQAKISFLTISPE